MAKLVFVEMAIHQVWSNWNKFRLDRGVSKWRQRLNWNWKWFFISSFFLSTLSIINRIKWFYISIFNKDGLFKYILLIFWIIFWAKVWPCSKHTNRNIFFGDICGRLNFDFQTSYINVGRFRTGFRVYYCFIK
jgi:hypothetical protein